MRHVTTKALLILLLTSCWLPSGCGSLSDHIVVKTAPEGTVFLERVPSRGTTVRYSGQLKSFRASHPVSLAPQVLQQALQGIHVGIAPSEGDQPSAGGIKPTPLFSSREAAFLAPAIANALEKAEPDQRVAFEVGAESDRSDGTLYMDGRTIQLALGHYHAPARRRDENLAIYLLSMRPEQAQSNISGQRYWMDITPDQPRLAINYDALERMLPATRSSAASSTAAAPSPPGSDVRSMKETVNKQAQELESLKAELEALKKQMQSQRPSSPSK
jgi:hypothetical protein